VHKQLIHRYRSPPILNPARGTNDAPTLASTYYLPICRDGPNAKNFLFYATRARYYRKKESGYGEFRKAIHAEAETL
jgi:hypothetical protein